MVAADADESLLQLGQGLCECGDGVFLGEMGRAQVNGFGGSLRTTNQNIAREERSAEGFWRYHDVCL